MPSKFNGKKPAPSTGLGSPGRIQWLDDLPDRLEADDVKGSHKERSGRGEPNDYSCEIRRKLGERFATAARLYAEAVVVFTSSSLSVSQDGYDRLREAAEEARRKAEAMGRAFKEHVQSHRC